MKIVVTSLVFVLAVPPVVKAETIDCPAGDVQCLIAAISQANADQRETTIRLAAGTYLLTSADNYTDGANGLPSIVSPVAIEAAGGNATLERSAAEAFRLLHVGPTGRLTLAGITLRGGDNFDYGGALLNVGGVVKAINSSFEDNSGYLGGAIYNDRGEVTLLDSRVTRSNAFYSGGMFNAYGRMTLTRTVVDNNHAPGAIAGLWVQGGEVRISQSRFIDNDSGHDAGAIYVSEGVASITGTTFQGNVADGAGAMLVAAGGDVEVRDSAFAGNLGTFGGAAIRNQGTVRVTNTTFARNRLGGGSFCEKAGIAVRNSGVMSITNSTFAENIGFSSDLSTCPPQGVIAGEIASTTILQNSIVVHNSDDLFAQDCEGLLTSAGNNLIGSPAGCAIALQSTDLIGEANLGAFTDDGSPGNAHYELLPESQAIGAASQAACPQRDQIGRPRRPACDIGAVEYRESTPDSK